MTDQALVVLSGGQDSVTCLGVAIKEHGAENVKAVSFTYGQRHEIELKQAAIVCNRHGIPHRVFNLEILGEFGDSALVRETPDVSKAHHRLKDLPASFVPNRNALMLTAAHAYAQKIGANIVYAGMCQTDYSGYPDCRQEFITEITQALNSGAFGRNTTNDIKIRTPLMSMTKGETWQLASAVGFLPDVLHDSHTCYNGDRETLHDWGAGCGKCPACELREKGFNEFLEANK